VGLLERGTEGQKVAPLLQVEESKRQPNGQRHEYYKRKHHIFCAQQIFKLSRKIQGNAIQE